MRVEGLSQDSLGWIVRVGRIESRQIRMDCESGGRQISGSGDTVQEQRGGRKESRNWEPLRKLALPQTISGRSDKKKAAMYTMYNGTH